MSRRPSAPTAASFPWAGFRRPPDGRLLEQRIALETPLGLAYERSIGFSKPFHVHDRPMFVCPRGSSVMTVRCRTPAQSFEVDSRHVLFVPKEVEHDNAAVTSIYDTLALYPSEALLNQVSRASGAALNALKLARTAPQLRRRSVWLEGLLDRYIFVRLIQRERQRAALEQELVLELLRTFLEPRPSPRTSRALPAIEREQVLENALRFIEARLFQPVSLEDICRHVGTSASSLLRRFREALGTTPYAYVKHRRLDEARRLLATGRYAVEEACGLVGYQDPATFSRSFKQRFGVSPSDVMKPAQRP